MAWLRLTLEVDAGQVEEVSEFLEQFNASSISLQPVSNESLFAGTTEEPRLWRKTSVSALVDAGTDMDILLACLRNRLGTENIFGIDIDLLKDRDWIESYKNSIKPLVFGDRLCIYPGWLQPDGACEHILTLEPGLAFGCGSHPTTRLCLEWLVHNNISNKTVIDYGCGSGILALAAARLGARHVFAVDIDPQALSATRSNAATNKLENRVSVLASDSAPPPADLLIANILLKPLVELSTLFKSLVNPGGYIVMSGILSTQVTECLETYSQWFKMGDITYNDEWALVNGHR